MNEDQKHVTIDWNDGGKSRLSVDWLLYQYNKQPQPLWNSTKTVWSRNSFKEEAPHVVYDATWDKSKLKELTEKIAEYGFCFVKGIPACPDV